MADLIIFTILLVMKIGALLFIPVLVYSPTLLGNISKLWQYTLLVILVIICSNSTPLEFNGVTYPLLSVLYTVLCLFGCVMLLRGFHKGKYPNLNKYYKEIGIALLALAIFFPLVISSLL